MPKQDSIRCLVTGACGFIGQNLLKTLARIETVVVETHLSSDPEESLADKVHWADFVFHLAGANRPENNSDFEKINVGLTKLIAGTLQEKLSATTIVFSSSIQAEQDHAYGISKRRAESILRELADQTDHRVIIYRLPNVFGKWSRPHYNSVVATFCHDISRNLPITVSDPDRELALAHIDEVVRCFLRHLGRPNNVVSVFHELDETYRITLGDLRDRLCHFKACRENGTIPDQSAPLTKYLYSTYTSFLPDSDIAKSVQLKTDQRGWLFEFAKSAPFGQVFVSKTKPGAVRGNHYHDTKVEKFCLIQGQGVIRLGEPDSSNVAEYTVSDSDIRVVDIPPGMTHSIENTGTDEMIVLFWSSEIFNPQHPDTHTVETE